MPTADDVRWFKTEFAAAVETAIAGTPFDVDMLTAIACQETGDIWTVLRKKQLSTAQILALCVGDTLDADKGRHAFPKTKADLVQAKSGQAMFDLAHQALADLAHYVPSYAGVAARADKFCHAFGIFQYDLQFFRKDPDYFLQKRYALLEASLAKCLDELHAAKTKIGWGAKTSLSDFEFACVAIAYNTGGFRSSKGLKQGYFDGSRYYGEQVFDFVRLARTVATSAGQSPKIPPPPPGQAILAPPTPVAATGAFFRVDTKVSTLRLRSEPKISAPDPRANVVGELPDGQLVRATTGNPDDGFLEVETSLAGAHLRGFAAIEFLTAAPQATAVPIATPAAGQPIAKFPAVYMPRKAGAVTTRAAVAGPHSLNEQGQPGRSGTMPADLCAELAAIVTWLAVDDPKHLRYQPHGGTTFCNVYAHDYCYLAGVYLPRVWWTPKAIALLAQGQTVEPLYGDTIDEMRANDLFRWLRDFGLGFGWRQTGSLTTLQREANQGALGVIVARRKEDGRSGHIVTIVPETDAHRARRDAAGEVVAPLQSQAGSVNFQYGTGRSNWWKGEQFAESAFWIHA